MSLVPRICARVGARTVARSTAHAAGAHRAQAQTLSVAALQLRTLPARLSLCPDARLTKRDRVGGAPRRRGARYIERRCLSPSTRACHTAMHGGRMPTLSARPACPNARCASPRHSPSRCARQAQAAHTVIGENYLHRSASLDARSVVPTALRTIKQSNKKVYLVVA